MFSSAKILCLNLIILFGLITSIQSDCQIKLPTDLAVRPSFYKNVGTHKLKINTNTYGNNYLTFHEEQKIEANCDTNFKNPSNYDTSNNIYIRCKNGYVYISRYNNVEYDNNYYNSPYLECARLTWHLYESSVYFDWCPSNVTSYILASPKLKDSLTSSFNYLAGICYDIYNASFYSVYYTLAPTNNENEQQPIVDNLYQPGIEIQYIRETFGYNSISAEDQFLNWINAEKYDFSSMIQHEKLLSTYNDQFASLLEFVWWPNLRSYNWKYYIKALEEHVENDKRTYDILAGVSGVIKVPIKKKCQTNYTMEEVVLNTNRKIPLYVWNYLQDRNNSTNQMVIIGYNSPFYEVYSQNDIIFCPDKCQEIPCLKDVSSSFYYKMMGVIFCCNVKDVRSSKALYGFPEYDIKPKALEVTQKPTIYEDVGASERLYGLTKHDIFRKPLEEPIYEDEPTEITDEEVDE